MTVTTGNDRVHGRARALAALSLLASLLVAGYLSTGQTNGPAWWTAWWLPAVIVAAPMVVARRELFEGLCVSAGLLVVVMAVVGFWFGLFLHVPAALGLFAASAADPRPRPLRARIAFAGGAMVTAATALLAAYAWTQS